MAKKVEIHWSDPAPIDSGTALHDLRVMEGGAGVDGSRIAPMDLYLLGHIDLLVSLAFCVWIQIVALPACPRRIEVPSAFPGSTSMLGDVVETICRGRRNSGSSRDCTPLQRLSDRVPYRELLAHIGRVNRYGCHAQPLRELLPTREERVPLCFNEGLALFQSLLHHHYPACPVSAALLRDALEIEHPLVGGEIMGKFGREAMELPLTRR